MDSRRIMAEIDRLARIPFWPGFDPRRAPFAVYDGSATYLHAYPGLPAGFEMEPGARASARFPGLHPAVRANGVVDLAGIRTATLLLERGEWRSATDWAALAIHEAFHLFQMEGHSDWAANEADLFIYPVEDAVSLCLSRLEVMALQRALRRAGVASGAWARTALALRRERFGRLQSWAVAYERGTELTEGLASYVERRAQGRSFATMLPAAGFSANEVRHRCYGTGASLAALLDRTALRWKERMQTGPTVPLDELLAQSLGEGVAASFTGQERETAMARAIADARDLIRNRRAMRDAYLDQAGWRIEIDAAAAPLMPYGFDPMNVELLDRGEVLHTRWIDLRSAGTTLEMLDRPVLTVAAGSHPLLDGVRRAIVTGLTDDPSVRVGDGGMTVEAAGCRLESGNAVAERRVEMIRIRLGGS